MNPVIKALWHALQSWVVINSALFALTSVFMIFGMSAKDASSMLDDMYAGLTPIIYVVVPGIGIASYVMNRLEEIVEGEHARN